MTRKEFLKMTARATMASCAAVTVGPTVVSAEHDFTDTPGGGNANKGSSAGPQPKVFKGERAVVSYTGTLSAPPERVFPLLCPVREYEWLQDWRCTMVYSESGVAEENCVFEIERDGGPMIWTVNRYEPPRRIEFVMFVPNLRVERLRITLQPRSNGTEIQWTRTYTGLSDAGNENIASVWKPEFDQKLTEKLDHFLKTGSMMRS